jgi:hypothetical protein
MGNELEHVAPILQAIASLVWAGFAFWALHVLKPEITQALGRLTKAEFLGGKFELKRELGELNDFATASEQQSKELAKEDRRIPSADQVETLEATVKSILQQATSEPKVALITLGAELEKQARRALATSGQLGDRQNLPLREAVNELNVPRLPGALRLFEEVRNKIVHGVTTSDDDALSALDSGLAILRALNALPPP